MPYDAKTIHHLSDFIQEQAQGALIRSWLKLNDTELHCAVKQYQLCSSAKAIEAMRTTLLEVAAAYPEYKVRKILIKMYGVFVKGK